MKLKADNEQKDQANRKLVYKNTLVKKQSIKIQCSFPNTKGGDKSTEVMSQLFRQAAGIIRCRLLSHQLLLFNAAGFLPCALIRRNCGICFLVGYFTLPLEKGNIMLLGKTNVLI